jgi:hypothetical protein
VPGGAGLGRHQADDLRGGVATLLQEISEHEKHAGIVAGLPGGLEKSLPLVHFGS